MILYSSIVVVGQVNKHEVSANICNGLVTRLRSGSIGKKERILKYVKTSVLSSKIQTRLVHLVPTWLYLGSDALHKSKVPNYVPAHLLS